MWFLIPVALVAAGIGWGVSKVLDKPPPLDAAPPGGTKPGAPAGAPPATANAAAALAAAKVQAEQAAAAALNAMGIPGLPAAPLPGTGRVDGHGTGVLIEDNTLRPATSNPADPMAAAASAANHMQDEIIKALNTPEGDRTPEQLALLIGVASLPTL